MPHRQRSGGCPLQVEQKGETGFLIWQFPIEVMLQIEEQPQQLITSKTIWGNVKICKESGG